MINFLILLNFLFILNLVSCDLEKEIYLKTISTDQNIFKFYNPDFDNYVQLIDLILNDQDKNLTIDCETSLRTIKSGLDNKDEWALKYYESNGSPQKGFLSGYHHDLGRYEICLSIKPNLNRFDSKFCLISIQTSYLDNMKKTDQYRNAIETLKGSLGKFWIDFSYGTVFGYCIPESCNIDQLLTSVNKILLEQNYDLKAVAQKTCSSSKWNTSYLFKPEFYISLLILVIPASLAILTLFFESESLRPFSIKENFNYVYTLPKNKEEGFLNGYKMFYALISIPAHLWGFSYGIAFFSFYSSGIKSIEMDEIFKCLFKRVFLGISVAFFYSGFTMFSATFDQVKNKRTNFLKSLIFFPMNFWPSYIFYIAILNCMRLFFNVLTFGDSLELFSTNLSSNFWKLFLFISNFDQLPDQSIFFSWFNSCLVQFFIISYLLILIFIKNEFLGLISSFTVLGLNMLLQSYLMIKNNIPPYHDLFKMNIISFVDLTNDYMLPYSNLDAYLIGFLTSWAYKNNKVSYLKNPFIFCSLFLILVPAGIIPIYSPELFELNLLPKSKLLLVLHFVTRRLLLSLILAFPFLSFRIGRFELVKNLLSFKYLAPFAKLASSLIVTQFFYFYYYLSSQTSLIKFTPDFLFRESFFALIITFINANIFFLLFEAPISRLLKKLILGKQKKVQVLDSKFQINGFKLDSQKSIKVAI